MLSKKNDDAAAYYIQEYSGWGRRNTRLYASCLCDLVVHLHDLCEAEIPARREALLFHKGQQKGVTIAFVGTGMDANIRCGTWKLCKEREREMCARTVPAGNVKRMLYCELRAPRTHGGDMRRARDVCVLPLRSTRQATQRQGRGGQREACFRCAYRPAQGDLRSIWRGGSQALEFLMRPGSASAGRQGCHGVAFFANGHHAIGTRESSHGKTNRARALYKTKRALPDRHHRVRSRLRPHPEQLDSGALRDP